MSITTFHCSPSFNRFSNDPDNQGLGNYSKRNKNEVSDPATATSPSAKRQKTDQANQANYAQFVNFFQSNPEALFEHAPEIKKNIKDHTLSISAILPILGIAAKNLNQQEVVNFDPPSIVQVPPKSLFRVFSKAIITYIRSSDLINFRPHIDALVKQDEISSDSYLSDSSSPEDIRLKLQK